MNHHFQYAHHRRIIVHNTNLPTASPISQLFYFFSDYCEKYCKEPPPQPERFEPCNSKNHRIVGVELRQHFSPANMLRQRTRNSTEIYSARTASGASISIVHHSDQWSTHHKVSLLSEECMRLLCNWSSKHCKTVVVQPARFLLPLSAFLYIVDLINHAEMC